MLDREQLKLLACVYFKDNSINEIYATADKQFFYKDFEARKYCSGRFLYYKFTRDDFNKTPSDMTPKQKLQHEAENLGLTFNSKATIPELEGMIYDKKLSDLIGEAESLGLDPDADITFSDLSELIERAKNG